VQELLHTVATATGVVFDAPGEGHTDPDALPDLPPTPVSRPADLWQLREHRLLCGDATVHEDVQRLFGVARAHWLWTDTPYGVDYEGKTSERLTIANDNAAGLPALLAGAFTLADGVLATGTPVCSAASADRLFLVFGQAFEAVGWHFHQTRVGERHARRRSLRLSIPARTGALRLEATGAALGGGTCRGFGVRAGAPAGEPGPPALETPTKARITGPV
jgi:hypothetical protein